jgi:hypothetical protein
MRDFFKLAAFLSAMLSWLIVPMAFAFTGYVTHIVACLKSASYVLLVAGCILPPVGVIHGYGYLLGFWQ